MEEGDVDAELMKARNNTGAVGTRTEHGPVFPSWAAG
jgi:hypothetical protein